MGNDLRASQREKKSLNDALPEILTDGTTSHPLLMQIALARQINQSCGGVVIAPWEVDQLDEVWLDAFRFSSDSLQSAQIATRKTIDLKNAWLSRHATYGKN